MKKVTMGILASLLALSTSAQAAVMDAGYSTTAKNITVELTNAATKPVIVYVHEEGFEIGNIDSTNINDKIVAFGEIMTGTKSSVLNLPSDITPGWYTVTVADYNANNDESAISLSDRQKKVYIVDETAVPGIVTSLSGVTSTNAETVLEANKDALNISTDNYTEDAGAVFAAIVAEEEPTNLDDFAAIYEKAEAVGMISNAGEDTVAAVLGEYGAELGISLGDDYTAHSAEADSLFVNLMDKVAMDKDSAENTKAAFLEAVALANLNSTDRTGIDAVLQTYNGIFNLDLAGVYATTDKVSFNKALERKNFADKGAVQTAFNNKVNEITNPKNNVSAGGGGSVVYKPTPEPTVTPEPTTSPEIENPTTDFSDINEVSWASEAILSLAEKGIMAGYGDNTCRPNNKITRNEYITMLVETFGLLDETAVYDCTDGSKDAWYAKYVASAKKAGIAAGYPDGRFGGDEHLTRQDMVVMLYRASGLEAAETEKFADDAEIADYAKEAIYALSSRGIVSGVGGNRFAALETATRAQVAVIINALIGGN